METVIQSSNSLASLDGPEDLTPKIAINQTKYIDTKNVSSTSSKSNSKLIMNSFHISSASKNWWK